MDYHDVKADLITMAKSLDRGFPILGVVGRAEIMDAPNPDELGGTFADNPLAVEADHVVIDIHGLDSIVAVELETAERAKAI